MTPPTPFVMRETPLGYEGFVLAVEGELDMSTAPQFKQCLCEAIEHGRRDVVVDLLKVSFLDSTALGVLIAAQRRLVAEGGHMAVVCSHPQILDLFEITGAGKALAIYPGPEAPRQ